MNTILLQVQSSENINEVPTSYYIIFYGLLFLVFWYFFIKKPINKQKQEQRLRESLKKGDKVITIGGIHGKIVEISDSTVVIENHGVKLKVEKSSVSMNSVAS